MDYGVGSEEATRAVYDLGASCSASDSNHDSRPQRSPSPDDYNKLLDQRDSYKPSLSIDSLHWPWLATTQTDWSPAGDHRRRSPTCYQLHVAKATQLLLLVWRRS